MSQAKPLTKKQQIALIENLFYSIPTSVQYGFYCVRDKLLEMCSKSEKDHRKGMYSSRYNLSVKFAAQYFTIQYLFEGMQVVNGQKKGYDINSILGIRLECLYGQALAEYNKEKLQEWFKLVSESEFSTLDYCELIK